MVLERMGKQKELLTTIKAQKLEYIGHIIRNNQQYNIPTTTYITRKD
jgi:hypothetical protein